MIALDAPTALRALNLNRVGTLAIGGFVNHRKPLAMMSLIHQCCPALRPKSLICLSASVDLDLALSLWPSIATVHCPFQGIEGIATISPLLEQRLRERTVTVPPWDTGLLALALRTPPTEEAHSLAGIGTDLPALNPMLREQEGAIHIQGLAIDLALLHVPHATPDGDVWYDDSPWGDGLLLKHADLVVASVGAIAPAPDGARSYPCTARRTLLTLVNPTGPTADPPRCLADLSGLRDLVNRRRKSLV